MDDALIYTGNGALLEDVTMTKQTFLELCGAALIDPAIALEQDGMREALAARDDAEVERIFDEEF